MIQKKTRKNQAQQESRIRVALAQMNATVGALEQNKAKILAFIAQAKTQDADLVIFPELALCGYPPEDLLLKEHFVRENMKILRQISRQVRSIVVVVGCVDQDRQGNIYNSAAVMASGKIWGMYHKQRFPNYGVFDEQRYFKAGQEFSVFEIGPVIAGFSICEDVWSREGPWPKQVGNGANLLVNLSSSPYDVGKLQQRKKILSSQAKKFQVPVVYVNLVGGQDELVFDGDSMIFDGGGRMIAQGKSFEEDLVVADIAVCAPTRRRNCQKIEGCLVRDKRMLPVPNIYQEDQIARVYGALRLGTNDYVIKNGFQKVLIGLSGGIDSALVAAIAADALGPENVVCVSMPSQFSSNETRADAKKLAANLGVEFLEIPIQKIADVYREELEGIFKGTKTGTAEENIQARIRGNILMALSNKFGWLVLTTGNKSEVAVGYCTLYGDMSGGFAVIKDVPKTMVYELARYRNRKGQFSVIPDSIIARAPSAELRPDQKDQDSLPPYEILDQVLEDYVERHRSAAQIARKIEETVVVDVIRLIDHSEYKRRQAPPGIKITPRAFGKDWRLPITNAFKNNFKK